MKKRVISILLALCIIVTMLPGVIPAIAAPGTITLRIHYHRPDNHYEGWNLVAWSQEGLYAVTGFSDADGSLTTTPGYRFDPGTNEVICTLTVPGGIANVGYVVRQGIWEAKDVEWDQFINLSGILSGTVDFYIESTIPSQPEDSGSIPMEQLCNSTVLYNGRVQNMMVLGEDVLFGTTITEAAYLPQGPTGDPAVKVQLSSIPDQTTTAESFEISSEDGSVSISRMVKNNNTLYLYLSEELNFDNSYTLRYQGMAHPISLPEPPLTGTYSVYALVPEDWIDVRVWCWNEIGATPSDSLWPGNISMAPTSNGLLYAEVPLGFQGLLLNANTGSVQSADIPFIPLGKSVLLDLRQDPQEPVIRYIPTEPDSCDHYLHSLDGACLICAVEIGHRFNTLGICSCGATIPQDSFTLYAKVPADWDPVQVWAIDQDGMPLSATSWPGDLYLTVADYGWYSITLPKSASRIMLIGDSGAVHTQELSINPEGNVYINAEFDYTNPVISYDPIDAGYVCPHINHNLSGICLSCGMEVGHSFDSDGTCLCGATDPSEDKPEDPVEPDLPDIPGKDENDDPTEPPTEAPSDPSQPQPPTDPPVQNPPVEEPEHKESSPGKSFDISMVLTISAAVIVLIMLMLLVLVPSPSVKKNPVAYDDDDD